MRCSFITSTFIFGFLTGCGPQAIQAKSDRPAKVKTASTASITSCIQSVCGPASANISNSNIELQPRPLNEAFHQMWTESVAPVVVESVESSARVGTALMNAYKSLMSEKLELPAREEIPLKAYARLLKIVIKLPEHYQKIIVVNDAEMSLDREALKTEFPEGDFTPAVLLMERFMLPRFRVVRSGIVPPTDSLGIALAVRHPKMDRERALKKDAQETLEKYDFVRKLLGQGFLESSNAGFAFRKLAEKVISTSVLTEVEMKDYADGANILSLIEFALRAENIDVFSADILSSLQLLSISLQFAKFEKLFPYSFGSNLAQSASQVSTVCEKRLNATLDITKANANRVAQAVEHVKRAASEVARGLVDNEKQRIEIRNVIRDLKVIYPDDTKKRIESLKLTLRQQMLSDQLLMSIVDGQTEGWKTTVIGALLTRTQAYFGGAIELETPATGTCRKLSSMRTTDRTFSTKFIEVSPFTQVVPTATLPVIGHEVGHAVSMALRGVETGDTKPMNLVGFLRCVADRNPFSTLSPPPSVFRDTKWSEEDFADSFATQVMNSLRKKGLASATRSKPIGCALVQDDGTAYKLTNTLEPSDGDPHSSGFLRILFETNDANTVTPECRPYLDTIEQSGRNLRCEL